ncbi:hypothetical protein LIA77_06597 [Sarocladium implicatum]|nr:hypothetical protein LIA77_06597 [Sarocladium implicatum]
MAADLFSSTPFTTGALESRSDTLECHSDRAGDYYGLGIRMGIYFAWLNAYLCHTILPSNIGSAASANTVFLLTLFLYGLWFWSYGIVGGLKTLGPDDGMESGKNSDKCSQLYTFFFTKLPADDGIRYYYIVVCAGCTLYFGCMLLASTLAFWFSAERLLGIAGDRWAHAAHVDTMMRPRYVTGFSKRELSMMFKVLRVANPIWLLWSIITIECTLNFNNVKGVLGGTDNSLSVPGQLLPFLIGGFGFFETLYGILKVKVLQKDFHDAPQAYTGFGPSVLRSTTDMEKNQQTHSWAVRYLVGWLPWLSLLHSYDKELSARGISRSNTTRLSSPATPAFPQSEGPWSPTSINHRMSMPMSPDANSYANAQHFYAQAPMSEGLVSPAMR